MRKRDVLNLMYEHVGNMVQDGGFRLNRKEGCFVRRIPGGKQTIGVALYDYNPKFIVTLVMTIRLDAVEDICDMFSGTPPEYRSLGTPPEYRSLGTTTITPLSYFAKEQLAEYPVVTEQDIVAVLDKLRPIVHERIIPFLDHHQDIKALNAAVNRAKDGIDSTQLLARAMHAVILARLADNSDFEHLVARYEKEMRPFIDTEKNKFNRLVTYLRE